MSGKISVIMATYNCEDTLANSIESVLAQTYTDWEFIICDDGSSDSTYSILEGFRKRYPDKFIILKNEKNMKLQYSLNRCLEKVTGKYVARTDADDLSVPDRFEKQVKYLLTHPEYDCVGTGVQFFDGTNILATFFRMENPKVTDLLTSVLSMHATIMTYPYVYEKLGGYSLKKTVTRCEDVDLWFRFTAAGFKTANIQEPLYLILENTNAVKRRKFKFRYYEAVTRFNGYRLIKMPKKYYVYILITLMKGLVPTFIYEKIHMKNVNKKDPAKNQNK